MKANDPVYLQKLKCAKRWLLLQWTAAGSKLQLFVLCTILSINGAAQRLTSFVQPLSGTAASTTASALRHSEAGSEKNANTIPSVGWPMAMTQWTPQTRTTENKCIAPYYFADSLFSGFRGTHWLNGSCTQDYGSLTIMPVKGRHPANPAAYTTVFRHTGETAAPHYYRLSLYDNQLSAELTATRRCGLLRFSMTEEDSLFLLVKPNSDRGKAVVEYNPQTGILRCYNPVYRIYQGWGEPAGFNGWFILSFSKRSVYQRGFSRDGWLTGTSVRELPEGGYCIGFRLKKGESLEVKTGTSFSTYEGAALNLRTETGGAGFNLLKKRAMLAWEKALSQLYVSGGGQQQQRIFYTALYHALQHPRLFSDADGTHPRFSKQYQLRKDPQAYYDDFSMWDIYRAQLPLLSMLHPNEVNDFVFSLIQKGEEGGWLPIFPCWNNYTAAMIGDHVAAFLASAFTRGIGLPYQQRAYTLMRKNAFETAADTDYANGKSRRALRSYLRYGYIPLEDSVPFAFHKKEQVSRTLEYAFDDYAAATVAKRLGYARDYEALLRRSKNYQYVFDTATGMVRGRYISGQWYAPFRPDSREWYITEGTPRQFTFFVPHDIPGLTALMGGKRKLEAALDSLFAKQEYWHGNEPGHHIPFLYNYTEHPQKTQMQVQRILADEYSDGAGGLSGNDDAGQMSAWYVFAAMGLYPVDPVAGRYAISTPLFDSVLVRLPNGHNFAVIANRASAGATCIRRILLNGKPVASYFLEHAAIMRGGVLQIELDACTTP